MYNKSTGQLIKTCRNLKDIVFIVLVDHERGWGLKFILETNWKMWMEVTWLSTHFDIRIQVDNHGMFMFATFLQKQMLRHLQ